MGDKFLKLLQLITSTFHQTDKPGFQLILTKNEKFH